LSNSSPVDERRNVGRPTIIAEIGCNHKGSMEVLRALISSAASFAKVDYIKLQKRCNVELLTVEEYDAPHPNPDNSYGNNYGAHREFLELTVEQHREAHEICREFNVGYSTSVWDLTSAQEIAALEPDFIKVPSACNLNMRLLEHLALQYNGGIHVSLGMTTPEEQDAIVELFRALGAAHRLVLYSCTSGYPVPHNEICLLEICRLRERYGSEIQAIGFSGHHLGIAVDIAAIALGASWVERHFTLDRTWKGTDHAASLEPDGMRRLVRDAAAAHEALTYKHAPILEVEATQRCKLKRLPGIHFPQ
jgi:sialic acid synthase